MISVVLHTPFLILYSTFKVDKINKVLTICFSHLIEILNVHNMEAIAETEYEK